MVFRISRGRAASRDDATAYAAHLREDVFPRLREIPGHRGAYLLQRPESGGEEVLIVTIWESLDAIRRFAGDDLDRAVFEPEAQRLLPDRDELVRHYDVALDATT